MAKTKIPWTQFSINPWVGCTKIKSGCSACYAERQAARLKAMGVPAYQEAIGSNGKWAGTVVWQDSQLEQLLKRKKSTMYFWGSMTDMFHEEVPFEWLDKCHAAMVWAVRNWHYHIHQILTKRPARMLQYYSQNRRKQILDIVAKEYNDVPQMYGIENWPFPNLWLGVSCSTQKDADEMIPIALQIPVAVHIVSFEPLLEEIELQEEWFERCPHCGMGTYDWARADNDTGIPDSSDDVECGYCGAYLGTGKTEASEVLAGIDWVIIGCERLKGNRAGRFCEDETKWWAACRGIVEQCKAAGVAVFVKQCPINGKVSTNNLDEWPEWARVQEMPK